MKHLIESQQFTKELLQHLFTLAYSFSNGKHSDVLKGKILATLFYEPSTRTRLSFEAAMHKLGGSVISTENAKEFSSAAKGEILEDSIRVISGYADCIVLRHHEDGSAQRAATVSNSSIINAGDGRGQHPTQSLIDVYTIYKEIGRLNHLTIAVVGDLANGRTVRSLCYLLGKYEGNTIIFISPLHLRIGDDIKAYLERHHTTFLETQDLNAILPQVDVVYMTRIQKERMTAEDYTNAVGMYAITEQNLSLIKTHARILHPLPHVEEIQLPIAIEQDDPRIAYFRQATNGLYVRMALLSTMLTETHA